ncbi:MAG TPA: NPCBM/NEW2 domain-containing protein [Planctomycetota bacterium]|nr:NPCBM/NEW2 domain-containing protein [Planctomycetota bacterium]
MGFRIFLLAFFLSSVLQAQQNPAQDDKILERGDKLLEEAKAAYQEARSKNSVTAFVDAGFRLEEARIRFIVLQEIGAPERQKTAADRLRAVNQLSKLIHDGKVAISGGAGEAPPSKPEDSPAPPPDPDPAAKPESKPESKPKKSSDVVARVPVPDAVKQRDAEKLIKDLFKEQYARKAPADRQALVRVLLDQATKTPDDYGALWVLYRDAQDLSVQIGDVRTAGAAIDATAGIFDVDAASAKFNAFMAVGKIAKTPAELATLTDALLNLVEELIAADQYEAADKAVTAAVQHTRRANDTALTARAAASAKETSEAKAKFQAMKSGLETLAKTPDDPGANSQMGQFLCFVKGNWDLGLRFIVKGSDLTLKALAEKEIAFPSAAAERAALADGWYDLADKEKSPLCRKQLLTHCKGVYESALPDSSGLLRAKIEKRLDGLQTLGILPSQPIIDLTTLTPKKATVGYFVLGVNTNVKNIPFLVQGKECRQYLFAHAPSSLVYDLPPRCKTFTATGTKLDKSEPSVAGTWKYLVIVDGKTLFESKPLIEVKGVELEISVTLPAGARELELKIDEMGENASDWSVWAYPRLVR